MIIDPNENYIPSFETYLQHKEEGKYTIYTEKTYGEIISIILSFKLTDNIKKQLESFGNNYNSVIKLLQENNISYTHTFYDYE